MKPAIDGRREVQRLRNLYWSPPPKKQAPTAENSRGSLVGSGAGKQSPKSNPTTLSLPRNWLGRLPSPLAYYSDVVPNMSITNSVGRGHCPMHTDTRREFLVRLDGAKGMWSCPVCGHGDMVSFVQRRYDIGFVESVRRLVLGGAN